MSSKPKIELNQATNKEFFVTIKSANNRKIMTSGETYKTRQGVDNEIKAVKKVLKSAEIVDNTKKKKTGK